MFSILTFNLPDELLSFFVEYLHPKDEFQLPSSPIKSVNLYTPYNYNINKSNANMENADKNQKPTDKPIPTSVPHLRKLIRKKIKQNKLNSIQKTKRFSKNIIHPEFTRIVSTMNLQCPICLDLLVLPCMMLCGHNYCSRCFDINVSLNQNCSVCRREQQTNKLSIPCRLTESLIKLWLENNSSDYMHYHCRINEAKEWIKMRKSVLFKLGETVDFKDALHIWRKGKVVRIINNNFYSDKIQVRFKIHGHVVLDTVEANCNRLAPYAFFTKGRYMENFAPIKLSKAESSEEQSHLLNQNQSNNKYIRAQDNKSEQLQLPQILDAYMEQSLIIDQMEDQLN